MDASWKRALCSRLIAPAKPGRLPKSAAERSMNTLDRLLVTEEPAFLKDAAKQPVLDLAEK